MISSAVIKDHLDLLLCFTVISYLTWCQDPFVFSTVSKSTLTFGGLYFILATTRLCQPPDKLGPSVKAEWRSRQLSTIHAVFLTIGSIFCFLQWPTYSETDMWVLDKVAHVDNLSVMRTAMFTCTFLGYLQWDLLWIVYYRKDPNINDPATFIHHVLYVIMTHYLLGGDTFDFVRPYAWLSFTELSTPFLNFRWFMVMAGKKESAWYSIWSVCFALTFLFTRVLCYTLGMIDLWSASSRRIWFQLPWGNYLVVAGIHAGYALNLFWSKKVVKALLKSLPSVRLQSKKTS